MTPGHPPTVGAATTPELAGCTVWWADRVDRPGLERLLSAEELRRADRLARSEDRSRYITGRVLLRLALSSRLDLSPARIGIRQLCRVCGSREHGRPEVVDADLAVSIAHAGDRVGVAVLDHGQVGLDVETLERLPGTGGAALAAVALAPEEKQAYDQLPPLERDMAALTWWTRKEALLKATGWGVAVPPAHLHVSAPDCPPALVGWNATQERPEEAVHLYEVSPGCGYIGCLAVLGTAVTVAQHDGGALLRDPLARDRARPERPG